MSTPTEKLFVLLQYVLPARLLGACVYRLARSQRRWLKNGLIRVFTRLYDVDQNEMERERATDYPSFNAFFTRALRPGARPIDPAPDSICSPADGTVQQAGRITAGQLLQAKGVSFSAGELLNAAAAEIEPFEGGAFATIYLAPHNYHRVHAPVAGTLRQTRFIPGSRYSVNRVTADAIPGLFARNERLACQFDGPHGPWWLVFVGAMNVASISTIWSGEHVAQRKPASETFSAETAPSFDKGDYIGHFNLGSTVIVLFHGQNVRWESALVPQRSLTVGARIGTL